MKPLIFFALMLIVPALIAQDHGNRQIAKSLSALDNLVGEWEGKGYIIEQKSRTKTSFIQSEKIYYDLDSTILVVEGQGTSEGKIVHDARAIISPSDSANHFDFYSFLADGRKGKFLMKKQAEQIQWFIEVPQGTIRYTITLNNQKYHEIGEFYSQGTWYPFMEMNLQKIN